MIGKISNFYERLVLDRLYRIHAERPGAPLDEDTVHDLACIALNRLPPRYARHSVDLAAHLTEEEWLAADDAVAEAIDFALATLRRRSQSRADE